MTSWRMRCAPNIRGGCSPQQFKTPVNNIVLLCLQQHCMRVNMQPASNACMHPCRLTIADLQARHNGEMHPATMRSYQTYVNQFQVGHIRMDYLHAAHVMHAAHAMSCHAAHVMPYMQHMSCHACSTCHAMPCMQPMPYLHAARAIFACVLFHVGMPAQNTHACLHICRHGHRTSPSLARVSW